MVAGGVVVEPAFEGLLEAFDFAAGGGMVSLRATSVGERPSRTTAVMTIRAFDAIGAASLAVLYVA